MYYYQVAVNAPLINSVFTYSSDIQKKRGELVELSFGRRKSKGVILEESSPTDLDRLDKTKIKQLANPIYDGFELSETELSLYEWMSRYYHYSLGKLIFDCLPKLMKRIPDPKTNFSEKMLFPYQFSDEQQFAYEKMSTSLKKGFSKHYLHGVTGSGKSIVFLKLIQDVLTRGQSVQVLLPEINLTPQFIQFFQKHLSVPVYSYHSGLSSGQKYGLWHKLRNSNEPCLVMGVRSSLFLPIQNLGLIVVDEEHDSSFKQTDRCPYNARDVSIKKAQLQKIPHFMSSATPSVENYKSFSDQQEHYYTLTKRPSGASFAKIQTIDMRQEDSQDQLLYWPLSKESVFQIKEKLEKKEQVLVFINKLGFSNSLQCRACGYKFVNHDCGCENNLRYFKAKNLLSCAHCEFKKPKPDICPECGNMKLQAQGFGTEKVTEVLRGLFKETRIERFDRDEIKNVKDLNKTLDDFNNGETDILVGTQMLAKGHNFEKVNLVVMLGVDSLLNGVDFRSHERAYSLCEQVAGRSGRYSKDGKVLIQTINPEHKLFEFLKSHELDLFYKHEISLRQLCECPPFTKMAMIFQSSSHRSKLLNESTNLSDRLDELAQSHYPGVRVLGPAPLMIEKKAKQYTWGIMLKSSNHMELQGFLHDFSTQYKSPSGVSTKLDVDPIETL